MTVGLAQTQEMITGGRFSIASGVQMIIPHHIFYRGQSLRLSPDIRPRTVSSQGPNPARTIGFSAPNNGPRLDLTLAVGEALVKAVYRCPLVPCTRWKEGQTYFLTLRAFAKLYQSLMQWRGGLFLNGICTLFTPVNLGHSYTHICT